jgi:hypothetical protein
VCSSDLTYRYHCNGCDRCSVAAQRNSNPANARPADSGLVGVMNKRFAASRFRRDALLLADPQDFLRKAGLCSTRQRIAVARLLLKDADRRVTAEILYDEAHEALCRFPGPPFPTRCANSSKPGCCPEFRSIGRSSLGLSLRMAPST